MKSIGCFLILCFVSASVSQDIFSADIFAPKVKRNFLVSRREKRATSGQCLNACLQVMLQGFENKFELQTMINQQVNSTQAQTFCKEYKKSKLCFEPCDSSMTKMIFKAFRPMDYLCIDHYQELLKYIPCYEKSSEAAENQCIPKCGGLNYINEVVDNMEEAKKTLDVTKILNQFDSLCGFLGCHMNCQAPVIKETCKDDKPAEFMKQFVRFSVENSRDLLTLVKFDTFFPNQCNKLTDEKQEHEFSTKTKPEGMEKVDHPDTVNSFVRKSAGRSNRQPKWAGLNASSNFGAASALSVTTLAYIITVLLA